MATLRAGTRTSIRALQATTVRPRSRTIVYQGASRREIMPAQSSWQARPYTFRASPSRSIPLLQGIRQYTTAAATDEQDVQPPDFLDEKEKSIFLQLREELNPSALEGNNSHLRRIEGFCMIKISQGAKLTARAQVQDVSGGCGSMYAVAVTSEKFRGLSVIKQHRLVNEILKEKIKDWHGLQLRTKAP